MPDILPDQVFFHLIVQPVIIYKSTVKSQVQSGRVVVVSIFS
jgi:hypothetical protein